MLKETESPPDRWVEASISGVRIADELDNGIAIRNEGAG